MPKGSLKLGLFDPGMTQLHRVGLAGLYMTLSSLSKNDFKDVGDWELTPTGIELQWNEAPKPLIERIISKSFLIHDGRVDFLAHRASTMSDIGKMILHEVVLRTYLQHNQWRDEEKQAHFRNFEFDGKSVVKRVKPILSYRHQKFFNVNFFNKKGGLKKNYPLSGWLFPGGAVRHVAFTGQTTLSTTPDKFLCLLFSPVASLYFSIYHRGLDGRYDKRKDTAIVLPDVTELYRYDHCYKRYLDSPVSRLYADSLGDAGLIALTALNVFDPSGNVQKVEVDSCIVITMGEVSWVQRQKIRTGLTRLDHVNTSDLNRFHLALRTLENVPTVKDDGGFYVRTSLARGLIADNIAAGVDWYRGFYKLMRTQQIARLVSFERKGLHQMVEKASWSDESDKLLVEAVHKALRNRYGALAARAKKKGESAQFGREFERIRTSLMRAKNAQTLRAELADIFARGNINKTLQENWTKILPLFTGPDWQRARDLALLALVSYSGAGLTEIEEEISEEEEI